MVLFLEIRSRARSITEGLEKWAPTKPVGLSYDERKASQTRVNHQICHHDTLYPEVTESNLGHMGERSKSL